MTLRQPQGLEPEPCPTTPRWIELRSQVVSCAVLLSGDGLSEFPWRYRSSSSSCRSVANYPANPTNAAKLRRTEPKIAANINFRRVMRNLLLDHHPIGLQQREGDQADDRGCRNEERIADFPAKQDRE